MEVRTDVLSRAHFSTAAVLMDLLRGVGCAEAPSEEVRLLEIGTSGFLKKRPPQQLEEGSAGHPGVHGDLPCFLSLNGKVVYFAPGFQDFHFLCVLCCVV